MLPRELTEEQVQVVCYIENLGDDTWSYAFGDGCPEDGHQLCFQLEEVDFTPIDCPEGTDFE